MRDIGAIQGFILELDDGTFASEFRVSSARECDGWLAMPIYLD